MIAIFLASKRKWAVEYQYLAHSRKFRKYKLIKVDSPLWLLSSWKNHSKCIKLGLEISMIPWFRLISMRRRSMKLRVGLGKRMGIICCMKKWNSLRFVLMLKPMKRLGIKLSNKLVMIRKRENLPVWNWILNSRHKSIRISKTWV